MNIRKILVISSLVLTFIIGIAIIGINQYKIYNSKTAFNKAVNYENKYNYNSALKYYSLVIEKDTDNYNKAKNKIEQIKELQIHIEAFENAKNCIANTDYENAYHYLVSVNKDILFKDNRYNAEQLQDALNTCCNNLISIGKIEYDNKNYIVAYKYWSLCCKNDTLDYTDKYNKCVLVYNAQGERFNRKNTSNKIIIKNTTVTVENDNDNISKGKYTTYLGEHTTKSGVIETVLYFDNGNYYIVLPQKTISPVILWDMNNADIFTAMCAYYNEEGAEKADKEVKEYKEFLEEQERIKNASPQIGMTKEQVEKGAWGKPNRINKTTYEWGTTEQWCYSNSRYVYFKNGKVTAISE